MSHFTRVRTRLADAELLAEALASLGLSPVEVHDEPQPLHGWGGSLGEESAQVIVRQAHAPGANTDVGFTRRRDGSFVLVVDELDRSRFDDAWLGRLQQAYGYAATVRYADAHGFEVSMDEVEADGTRRLTLRRTN